jgi:hypothetical protein
MPPSDSHHPHPPLPSDCLTHFWRSSAVAAWSASLDTLPSHSESNHSWHVCVHPQPLARHSTHHTNSRWGVCPASVPSLVLRALTTYLLVGNATIVVADIPTCDLRPPPKLPLNHMGLEPAWHRPADTALHQLASNGAPKAANHIARWPCTLHLPDCLFLIVLLLLFLFCSDTIAVSSTSQTPAARRLACSHHPGERQSCCPNTAVRPANTIKTGPKHAVTQLCPSVNSPAPPLPRALPHSPSHS